MYKLKNWSVVFRAGGFFTPPEYRMECLAGEIYNRPEPREFDGKKFPDGKNVTTSYIVKAEGRIVTTYSGSQYELEGPPHPDYAAWCQEKGMTIDPENPVKVKKSDA